MSNWKPNFDCIYTSTVSFGYSYIKQGRKRPLDTPERKIKRRERDRERERDSVRNIRWWRKNTSENITTNGDKKLFQEKFT